MREKWKIHRGWIKVHLAVDVKTKEIVAIEVTDERVSDGSKFNSLIDQAEENLPAGRSRKHLAMEHMIGERSSITSSKREFNLSLRSVQTQTRKQENLLVERRAVRELKDLGISMLEGEIQLRTAMGSRICLFSSKKISGEHVMATKQKI